MKRGIRSKPRWLIGSFLLAMFVIPPLVLAACGGDDDEDTTTAPAPTAQVVERTVEVVQTVIVVATPAPVGEAQFFMKPLDPFPKRGGDLKLGAHGPPAHFDWYASNTIGNLGSQGAMYDQLVRRDGRTPATPIVPDLAFRWEVASDGMTYTFNLREGVLFHDGDELTSADIKATYDRIIFPTEELVSLRKAFFPAISEVNTLDKYTVEFKLAEPRASATLMAAFASEWMMVSKKSTFDENSGNLRLVDDHPGTGPFVYVSRDDDSWELEANPNYWNPDAPWVDTLEHIWLVAWTPENTAALLGGNTDWTMWLAPKDGRDIGGNPGLNGARMNSFTQGLIPFNTEAEPFTDKRVRRAFWLAVDEPAIQEATKDVQSLDFGGFFVKGTPFAMTPAQVMATPGMRSPTDEDIAEAQALLAEAGYPNGEGIGKIDLLTREVVSQRIMAPAIQAMLKQNLNVDAEIRIVDISAVLEEMVEGNFDMGVLSASKSLAGDPADYMRNAFGTCAGDLCDNNFSRWRNDEFDSLMRTFEQETDLEKQIGIASQIRDVLFEEMPSIPFSNSEIVYWGWADHLKGLMPPETDFFTWYEFHKWDNVWLDR